ncbi:MAG: Ig-like domain-containing protein [Anaerolineae bacterium]
MSKRVMLRSLLCIALVAALAAAYLPAAAQEGDAASWLVTNERGTVGLSAPAADASISGAVDIVGTATSAQFSFYNVEYSFDGGTTWVSVDATHKTAVAEGTLATWDTTAVANGAYWLRAVVVDNTGNWVASNPVAVTIANEAAVVETVAATPEATATAVATAAPAATEVAATWLTTANSVSVGISSPAADAALTGSASIEGTATAAPGVFSFYKVEYSVDGSSWVSVDASYKHATVVTEAALATWDTTTVADGAYWLRAVVVDNTGNYVASVPIMVSVANAGAAPVATATAEATAEATATATAEATAAATAEATATATAEATPVPLPAPLAVVGITAPEAGATLSGSVEITGTATSVNFSFYMVEYSVDGSKWVSVDASYKHTAQVTDSLLTTWDTTGVPNGSYWLRASVVDTTGNYVSTEPIMVTVANEAAAATAQ